MPRADSIGLFWEDIAPVKPPKKEKVKKTPPAQYWLEPGFIPPGAYEEACSFNFNEMNDMELIAAWQNKHKLIYDVESYPNYGLHGFKNIETGKHLFFESSDFGHDYDRRKLAWVLANFTLITFNGIKFDETIAQVACQELYDHTDMWAATCMLIQEGCKGYEVLRHYGISYKKKNKVEIEQIDVIELTAQAPGLKKCAARLHAPKLQDLPFKPGTVLSFEQCLVLKRYNVNDLDNTHLVYTSKLDVISLREEFGARYDVDLRSKSDAQMAEAIIRAEYIRLTGDKYIKPAEIAQGTTYRFKTPSFVKFQTPYLNSLLKLVQDAHYVVGTYEGGILNPPEFTGLKLKIADGEYAFGIGGLHSKESNVGYVEDDEYFIADTDATSYYPTLILNAGLTPTNMGQIFLKIYRTIYETRIAAKKTDPITAQCLKIVLNGSFGKLANMFSVMYAPNLMMQVTLTGQLSLLMLIERFELAGIKVINANTDGVVVRCKRSMRAQFDAIVKQWGKETGFGTEETRYKSYLAKDVNNYIATYTEPDKGNWFKTKGLYAKTSSMKNAVNEICVKAIKDYFEHGTSIAHTIRSCDQVSMFTTMRELAKGGGGVYMKDEKCYEFLGKTVRWYYSTQASGQIVMANSGNKVPRSDGAVPCMNLPNGMPEDLDYEWYINESYSILEKVGQSTPQLVE
jgi:hypothetical protein